MTEDDIEPGEIFEDVFYHPCLCMGIMDDTIWGISLVDGSHPRCISIGMSGPRKLTLKEAWRWKFFGPEDEELDPKHVWWEKGNCVMPSYEEWHVGERSIEPQD